MAKFFNQLEPQSLVGAFLKHPPQDFQLVVENEIPAFNMQFNLLTTLDTPLRKKIENLYLYKSWGKLFVFPTCFIGTTVSEYTPLLASMDAEQALTSFKKLGKDKSLTIIKDLPLDSPLLTIEENQYSQDLIKFSQKHGFIAVEGQALAYVPIDFLDREEYLSRLSKSRRKNLKRKLKSLDHLKIKWVETGAECFENSEFRKHLYALYLAVYEQSEIHFDLLTSNFFDEILLDHNSGGRVALYWDADILVGYNICYEYNNNFIDKYIGLNYELAIQHNLYFVSWFVNLDYALQQKLKYYVAGWTDPEVKAQLGAQFTFTQHLVWIRQPVLRKILTKLKPFFEADSNWHQKQNNPTN